MQIFAISVLFCASFALVLIGRMANANWIRSVLSVAGIWVWWIAWSFESINADLLGFLFLSIAISELIATYISRKRVKPPRVQVGSADQEDFNGVAGGLLGLFLLVPLGLYLTVRDGFNLFWGLGTISLAGIFVRSLFYRIEICSAGLWHSERLHPWKDYEFFTWERETKDVCQLMLVSKSRRPTQLLVSPEDHEAVQQLLAANLPYKS